MIVILGPDVDAKPHPSQPVEMVGPNSAVAVYITASGRNGTLYIGVTSELQRRVAQHKHGLFPGFSKRYGCTRLVWFELQGDMRFAIQREKNLKRWLRAWKLALIDEHNPQWRDLAEDWWEPGHPIPSSSDEGP